LYSYTKIALCIAYTSIHQTKYAINKLYAKFKWFSKKYSNIKNTAVGIIKNNADKINFWVASKLFSYITSIIDNVVIIGATARIHQYFGCIYFAKRDIHTISHHQMMNFDINWNLSKCI
jgi:hypothetical protein